VTRGTRPWNHNIHYHPVILEAVPAGARRALDVGCGEGTLARELRAVVPRVTAIDADPHSIDVARRHDGDVDFVLGDVLTHAFEAESFDLVASVAALHHMDATMALARIRDLLCPGGTLAIVGLARTELPRDLPFAVAGAVASRFYRLTSTYSDHASPTVWPPPESFRSMRALAHRALPGARYRRRLLWRYSLIWTKPSGPTGR
jgi:2-polyprenyl-3-methyl-5-hydroxy-6-metoxy-1,4-benzoquinol methylase